MKKFLSMVMAAAMVVSLVPATAFAAQEDVKATAKVVDAKNYTETEITSGTVTGPELQLRYTDVNYTKGVGAYEFTLTLDNAEFTSTAGSLSGGAGDIYVLADGVKKAVTFDGSKGTGDLATYWKGVVTGYNGVGDTAIEVYVEEWTAAGDDEVSFVVKGAMNRGDVLAIALDSTMDKTSKGKTATVTVDSDDMTIANGDDLVYASVESKGIKVSVKDTVDVATEEVATMKDIKIEPAVGDYFNAVLTAGTELKLKLNAGFEFVTTDDGAANAVNPGDTNINSVLIKDGYTSSGHTVEVDEDEIIIPVDMLGTLSSIKTLTIENLGVEAVSAKAGSTATIKVYADGCDTVSVEVAKTVDYTVSMTVDEDDDVPVIYSGVNVANDGIVDDSDHESLEVTIKESFAGAWNSSKDFTLSLPEGVYVESVANANFDNDANASSFNTNTWFADAYNEGDYVDLTFKRRTWEETRPDVSPKQDPAELTFKLVLVADPNFEGDVVLKLTGDAVEEQEVTIAKFVKPYTVEAQQNDMQIDYRNTVIPTSVVIKEAEAGLWDKDTTFELYLDKIELDDEGKVTVDEKSGLEVKDNEVKRAGDNGVKFTVSSRSDDEPAVVTIEGLELYMERSLPAGAYDLEVVSPEMLGQDKYKVTSSSSGAVTVADGYLGEDVLGARDDVDSIADINDDFYSETAKAGFVNIVTAGREDTDSFTTKVVVPVGESYLISGENKVEIPVPAYINAAGYTMLPLRAVAVALGINENNVLWDQTSRTATVMYGSKIINMTLGQKVVYVNGAMIPATAAVEITNDRMFLGLRDLGTALGVTDITWDGATKTATLNGNK